MSLESRSTNAPLGDRAAAVRAWLLSIFAHLLLAVLASLLFREATRSSPADEPTRRGEIVLASRNANQTDYFTDERQTNPVAGSKLSSGELPTSPAADQLPFLSGISLPQHSSSLPIGGALANAPQFGPGRGRVRVT